MFDIYNSKEEEIVIIDDIINVCSATQTIPSTSFTNVNAADLQVQTYSPYYIVFMKNAGLHWDTVTINASVTLTRSDVIDMTLCNISNINQSSSIYAYRNEYDFIYASSVNDKTLTLQFNNSSLYTLDISHYFRTQPFNNIYYKYNKELSII